jgi:hypothetical protein
MIKWIKPDSQEMCKIDTNAQWNQQWNQKNEKFYNNILEISFTSQ